MTPKAKGLGHAGFIQPPPQDVLPAWRAALAIYRRQRYEGKRDIDAWRAAVAAYQEALPDTPLEVARAEVTTAIHWASVYHTDWLWCRDVKSD